MLPDIECMYPDLGSMIGYAVTRGDHGRVSRGAPRAAPRIGGKKSSRTPEPRVVVIHDIDRPVIGPSGRGQCQHPQGPRLRGHGDDGSVRDMAEVERSGVSLLRKLRECLPRLCPSGGRRRSGDRRRPRGEAG